VREGTLSGTVEPPICGHGRAHATGPPRRSRVSRLRCPATPVLLPAWPRPAAWRHAAGNSLRSTVRTEGSGAEFPKETRRRDALTFTGASGAAGRGESSAVQRAAQRPADHDVIP
jgi:hypothetical protein